MGLLDKIRSEFIDIIEWTEQDAGTLAQRFERHDHEIKMNAKLVVRPGQRAVFVNEGEIADVFEPGTHTLETKNMPILATLKGWKYGFDSPFKAEVYFINTTELLDRKWGTPSPVMMRDADFGVVRLRARGNFSYKVGISAEMISRFVGSQSSFSAESMESQLRVKIVSSFSDCIGESKIPALDLLSQYDEISAGMKNKLDELFGGLGLELLSFVLENVSVPEEVQTAMDQRASMGALGNMNQFAQFQAANALRDAAGNEGGMAGNMMGMMVGGQIAGGMGNVLHQDQPAAQQPAAAEAACNACGKTLGAGAKFCPHCGADQAPPVATCVKCEAEISEGSKFCPKCGAPQSQVCAKCGKSLDPGAKFCPECGSAS